MFQKLRNYIIGGLMLLEAALFPNIASASDIFLGVKGPTEMQLDGRVTYSSSNDKKGNLQTLTNNLILKYWDGDETGKWFFVNVPYKLVFSDEFNNGIADVIIGGGLRGRIGNFHMLPYISLSLPTGEAGNRRYDTNIGVMATYLTTGQGFEVDGSLEHKVTGIDAAGLNPPNETSGGMVAGIRVVESIRLATGATGTVRNNGDYVLNSRTVLRYTPSKALHFELVGDAGIASGNMPKGFNVGIIARYNF